MIPQGARIFPLKHNSKAPLKGSRGHLGAQEYLPELGYPTWNYGIALDGMYLVVDIDCDHPERAAFEASLPITWTQQTARTNCVGMHYLYRVPQGFKGKNGTYKASDGTRIADIKVNGYIVGPGSSINGSYYRMVVEMEPTQL